MTIIANIRLKDVNGATVFTLPVRSGATPATLLSPGPGDYTVEVEHLLPYGVAFTTSLNVAATTGVEIAVPSGRPVYFRYRSQHDGQLNLTYVEDPGTGPVNVWIQRAEALPGQSERVLSENQPDPYESGATPPTDGRYVITGIPVARNVEYMVGVELNATAEPAGEYSSGRLQFAFAPNPR